MIRKFFRLSAMFAAVFGLLLAGCTEKPADENPGSNGDGNVDETLGGLYDTDPDLFEVRVTELSSRSCTVTVVPKKQEMSYLYVLVDKLSLDELGGDAEKLFQTDCINKTTEEYGIKASNRAVWDEIVFKGTTSGSYIGQLWADDDYAILVAGVTRGIRTSDVTVFHFHSLTDEESVQSFNIFDDGGTVVVQPSILDSYFCNWYWLYAGPDNNPNEALEKDFSQMSDEEVIEYFESYKGSGIPDSSLKNGEAFWPNGSYLESGKSYTVIVFGYSNGRATTDVFRHIFTYNGINRKQYTSLTSDYNFDTASSLTWSRERLDALPAGLAYWTIRITGRGVNAEYIDTAVLTDSDATEPLGKFELADWPTTAGYAFMGDMAFGFFTGTWWIKPDSTGVFNEGRAIGDSGTVEIRKEGNTYYANIEFKDPNGNTVTCSYQGSGREVASGN